ncbi:MAG: HAMP domain-containing histidine kinase [Chloroflexi bacterium]|nr:HAMP domain-containing histidine kinase [Chloroflexota bacterium]
MEKKPLLLAFSVNEELEIFLGEQLSDENDLKFVSGLREIEMMFHEDIPDVLFICPGTEDEKILLEIAGELDLPPEVVYLFNLDKKEEAIDLLKIYPGEMVTDPMKHPDWLKTAVRRAVGFRALLRRYKVLSREHNKSELLRFHLSTFLNYGLREQITSIQGFAELIQASPGKENVIDNALRDIQESSKAAGTMLDKLLKYLQLESGNLGLKAAPVNLESLLETCLLNVQRKTESHWFDINVEPFSVLADSQMLSEALSSILDNAVKFSPGGGVIKIFDEKVGDEVRVVIEDNGIGIPEDAMPHLFEPFFRLKRDVEARRSGSGLSLLLARAVILIHGGRFEISSKEGEGTKIEFTLPLVKEF